MVFSCDGSFKKKVSPINPISNCHFPFDAECDLSKNNGFKLKVVRLMIPKIIRIKQAR